MIAVSNLRDHLDDGDDLLVFDADGSRMDIAFTNEIGSAALLVTTVTDAVKTLTSDGRTVDSLDREATWAVQGFALRRTLIQSLPELNLTPEGLLDAVVELGMEWEVRVVDSGFVT